MGYTTIYTGNVTVNAGPVAAGGTVAGLKDLSGNRLTVSNGKFVLTPGNLGDEFWVGHLLVPGSDAELNSKARVRLPANAPNTFNVGLTARVQEVSSSFLRRRGCFGQFCISSVNNPGVPYFGVGVVASSASQVDVTQDQDGSWYVSSKAYDLEFEVTSSSPTTMTLRAIDVLTGSVVHSISGTTTDPDMQNPGLCGLCHTQLFGQTGAGPTAYSAYTVSLESTNAPLVANIGEGVSVVSSNVINVLSATGGVPATSGAPYTYALYGVKNVADFTPGPANRLDGTSAVSVAPNGNGANLPQFSHTVTPGDLWFYRVVVTDARTPSPATTTATTIRSAIGAISDYLIVLSASAPLGVLPPVKTEYANGCIVAVCGNSFIHHVTDSITYSQRIKAYLEATGVAMVHEVVMGFPGSAYGADWGANSPVFAPGGNGPTGLPFGAYGIEGNRTNKNLLANTVDRIAAASTAHPGLPVLVVFYELTNWARGGATVAQAVADVQDIVTACQARGWKLVLEGPAWLPPGSTVPTSGTTKLVSGQAGIFALANGTTVFAGSNRFLPRSFTNADEWFYGTGTDNSGVHVTPAAELAMGDDWGQNLRRTVMAGDTAITSQPSNVARIIGQTATFAVTATGTAPLTYQWRKNSGGGFVDVAGATNASYTTPALTLGEDGTQWQCLVSGPGGSVFSTVATLTVTALPMVATPTFTPAGGTYTAVQSVVLACATAGAAIYYTTNGTTPTTASTLYNGEIPVGASETLKAFAVKAGMTDSQVATAVYTINLPVPTVSAPTFTPEAGPYTAIQSVTLACAEAGAAIHYTTDGTTPTAQSAVFLAPIVLGATTTIKAIGTKAGFASSVVASATFTITLSEAVPVASVAISGPVSGTVRRGSVTHLGATVLGINDVIVPQGVNWSLMPGAAGAVPGVSIDAHGALVATLDTPAGAEILVKAASTAVPAVPGIYDLLLLVVAGTPPALLGPEMALAVTPLGPGEVPGISTQRHRFNVVLSRGHREFDATVFPLEIAHYDRRSDTDLTWIPLHWDDNGDAYLIVGPGAGADLTLTDGLWYRSVRVTSAPRIAINLEPVTILLPNPPAP